MIDTLIQATTPSDSKSSDPFWVKSETAAAAGSGAVSCP